MRRLLTSIGNLECHILLSFFELLDPELTFLLLQRTPEIKQKVHQMSMLKWRFLNSILSRSIRTLVWRSRSVQ